LLLPPISTLFPYTTLFRSLLVFCTASYRSSRSSADHFIQHPSGFAGCRVSWEFYRVTAIVEVFRRLAGGAVGPDSHSALGVSQRSEEHTSELSHDQISYAV